VLEDSSSVGGSSNSNGTPITASQLAAIPGLVNVDLAQESGYQSAIAAETGFSNPVAVAQVQVIIDTINGSQYGIAEVLEDSSSVGGAADGNGAPVTASQLSAIIGIVGVVTSNEASTGRFLIGRWCEQR